MNQIWIIVAALIALLLITRIRSKRNAAREQRRPPSAGPRIQGFQLSAYIHPQMSAACVFDSGLQFGKGFRRKEGPPLPHDGLCRCEAVPFSFSSSEVFNGALRNVTAPKCSVPGVQGADAQHLADRLKAVEAQPLPAGAEAYAAALGVETFPAELHAALAAFAAERYAFLTQSQRDEAQKAPSAPDPLTSDRLDTSEPS